MSEMASSKFTSTNFGGGDPPPAAYEATSRRNESSYLKQQSTVGSSDHTAITMASSHRVDHAESTKEKESKRTSPNGKLQAAFNSYCSSRHLR